MKSLWIVKAGTTFPCLRHECGDFEQWTIDALEANPVQVRVFDVASDVCLPGPGDCAGVVVTGSHAMVTDRHPWSVALENWIPQLLEADVPFLGICYGHQLLARAMGGEVDYHRAGQEIGTVDIQLLPPCAADPLFCTLPETMAVHTVHSQTVASLPIGAVRLAGNDFEPNHAIRIGTTAWGVQFHPEYDDRIMRSYIEELADELQAAGRDVSALAAAVHPTPDAQRLLARFAEIVKDRT
ncbi:MAG: glutamine amidotransferase [Pirellulaceae bacterium]